MADHERRRVGIVVPPRYFDTTWRELTELDQSIDVLTTQMRMDPSFDFSLDDRYSDFVTGSGLEISSAQSFADQGHFPTAEAAFEASFHGFSDDLIAASIQEVADNDPSAEVILVPGMPGKILRLIPGLESSAGRPVASYFSIWWKGRSRLGLAGVKGFGQLLARA